MKFTRLRQRFNHKQGCTQEESSCVRARVNGVKGSGRWPGLGPDCDIFLLGFIMKSRHTLRLVQEGIANTCLSHQVSVGWRGRRRCRPGTARLNKDYVTVALMSFSSKQLLPACVGA